jgi:RNA polymerase sigma-70 factor (ECF subfamily)
MGRPSPEPDERTRFERLVLPHLDAAYDLALWLVRDPVQAEEAVQEACLRALRYFSAFRGANARPWLLGIVRNTCYTLISRAREAQPPDEFDESRHGEEALAPGAVVIFPANPEAVAIENADRERVRRCLRELAPEYREALILRELHECSYREIATITAVPIGTVMSRLARARRLLQRALSERTQREETGT